LIAGLGGVLPDLDIAVYWILHWFGFTLSEVHRTFTHNIFVPFSFLILFFIFRGVKIRELGKHKLKLNIIFLMLSLGTFTHLVLDAVLSGSVMWLYPFYFTKTGLNLVGMLEYPLDRLALPCLDAALLVLWIVYLEWKHKITDFI